MPTSTSLRQFAGRAASKIGRTLLTDPGAETRGAEAVVNPDAFTIPPWVPMDPSTARAMCPVCRWEGEAFEGRAHVELSLCPSCRANGRDRFLHWCMSEQVDLNPGLRVVECSPGLGELYQTTMATWFFYRASDYDL